MTEKQLLSIVETLKEFQNILLGNGIKVFLYHNNITYKTIESTSQRVQRWKILIQEFGTNLIYIKVVDNLVVDAFSPLPMAHHAHKEQIQHWNNTPVNFCVWGSYSFMVMHTVSPYTQRRYHFL